VDPDGTADQTSGGLYRCNDLPLNPLYGGQGREIFGLPGAKWGWKARRLCRIFCAAAGALLWEGDRELGVRRLYTPIRVKQSIGL